jgi:hypothetical protein
MLAAEDTPMEIDEFAQLMEALEDGNVLVRPDGVVLNYRTGKERAAAEVRAAAERALDLAGRLARIAEWAAAAPERKG